MYRRIVDYFAGTATGSTEGAVQVKKEETSKGDDETSKNEIAKLIARIEQLERELKVCTNERDDLKKKLEFAEKEILKLQTMTAPPSSTTSTGVGEANVTTCDKPSQQSDDSVLQKENENLRSALSKSDELLKEKSEHCANQERQNVALTSQVASLKEVVAITKDLLNIRNMEVEHLHTDMESMEGKINAERSRHNDLLQKMDEAATINAKLKSEYQTQLKIFQDLKEKYEEKVNVLNFQKEELQKQVQLSRDAQKTVQSQKPKTSSKDIPKEESQPKSEVLTKKEAESHSKGIQGSKLHKAQEQQIQKVIGSSPAEAEDSSSA